MVITLLIIHALVTIAMIGLILLQKSDGSGPLGIGGGNNALFTARGVANILTRTTAVLAALFIGNCILIGILTNRELQNNSILFSQPEKKQEKTVKKEQKPQEKEPTKPVEEPAKPVQKSEQNPS